MTDGPQAEKVAMLNNSPGGGSLLGSRIVHSWIRIHCAALATSSATASTIFDFSIGYRAAEGRDVEKEM